MADSTCCLPLHCPLLHVSSSPGGPGFVPDTVVKLWAPMGRSGNVLLLLCVALVGSLLLV